MLAYSAPLPPAWWNKQHDRLRFVAGAVIGGEHLDVVGGGERDRRRRGRGQGGRGSGDEGKREQAGSGKRDMDGA